MSGQKAIFIDRDGTIIEDQHYPRDAEAVKLLPGATEGLKMMVRKGYKLYVISNQSGVGRGIISDKEFLGVHKRTCELLQDEGIEIVEFAYCLHHPDDNCRCRKPETGLVPKEIDSEPIDFEKSYMIGDRKSDLALAKNLGAQGVLVLTGKGQATKEEEPEFADHICDNLLELAKTLPKADV